MRAKQVNPNPTQKVATVSNGITIAGFLLFITGVVLFSVAMIEILVHINSVKTAVMILGGLALYKIGFSLIRHCATLRTRPGRRRQVLQNYG